MEKPFCTEYRGEDLLNWSDNLDALGIIVNWLGYYENGDEILNQCGKQLGMIISDYARAISKTIGEVTVLLNEHFKDESLSHELKKELKIIQRGYYCRADIERIEKAIEKAKTFMIEAPVIIELRDAFLKIREDIVEEFGAQEQK